MFKKFFFLLVLFCPNLVTGQYIPDREPDIKSVPARIEDYYTYDKVTGKWIWNETYEKIKRDRQLTKIKKQKQREKEVQKEIDAKQKLPQVKIPSSPTQHKKIEPVKVPQKPIKPVVPQHKKIEPVKVPQKPIRPVVPQPTFKEEELQAKAPAKKIILPEKPKTFYERAWDSTKDSGKRACRRVWHLTRDYFYKAKEKIKGWIK